MPRPLAALLVCTAIAGCAGPAAREATTLPPAPPPVRVDRVYLSVDSATYQGAKQSAFLRDRFAHVQERTSVLADGTARTVLDVDFDSSGVSLVAPGPLPEGWATLVFAADNDADLVRARDAMSAWHDLDPMIYQRTAEHGGAVVQTHRELVPAVLGEGRTLRTRVIAYQPGAFAVRGSPVPDDGRLTTRAYLNTANDRLAGDIAQISVALGPRDAASLDQELSALGYHKRADSKVTSEYAGPAATFRFFDGSNSLRQYRILGVTVALKQPVPEGRENIGPHASIRFDGKGNAEIRFE